MESTQVAIDLSKEKFNFSAIQNLEEITTLRFVNYTDKIEIPLAINDYPNITVLKFIGKSGNGLFEVPDNLEKFIHVKALIVWNFSDFSQIKPMPELEEFHTLVKNVQLDTREIITLFPNLKGLIIGGYSLKNQKLPHEIGSLSSLEELHLMSIGLTNLPNSLGNLKQMKKFVSDGNNLNGFPEIITQLENLEILEISQRFSALPDSFINLKKLKKLQLSNHDGFPSSNGRKIKLTPIPAVIGKLENIEDLDIELVDLYDITPILPLKNLKKLSLKNSALQNCKGFSNFPLLEDLNLEKSFSLRNLDGLEGLPIKKLNLSWTRLQSLDELASLESLEILDLSACFSTKDFSAVINHPAIKELKADDQVIAKWQERKNQSPLVNIDDVIRQLTTDDLKQFEESITHLSDHVNANYIGGSNPLAGYFNTKAIDDEITSIEVLDSAVQKHLKNLSDKTLVTIFEMTFKKMGYDNYTAALLVLEEIISRKNTEIQLQIVHQFHNACEDYSAGHRFWSGTVQDQLISRLFAQFTSEALCELLKIALKESLLDRQDGDSMDILFIPALQNTEDSKLQKEIITVFLDYEEQIRTYVESNYFDNLFQQIEDIVSPELIMLLETRKTEIKEEQKIIDSLKDLKEENLPTIIDMLGNEISKNLEENYFYSIIQAAKNAKLPEASTEKLLNFLIETDQKSYLSDFMLSQYDTKNPEKIIAYLKIQLEKNYLKTEEVSKVIGNAISSLIGTNKHLEELKIYEDFMVSYCDTDYDQVYAIEVNTLLDLFFASAANGSDSDLSLILENIKTILKKIVNEIEYDSLQRNITPLMNSGKFSPVKQVFETLYPKVKQTKVIYILRHNMVASIMLKDKPYFDLIFNEVQQSTEMERDFLALNIACGFAVFDQKEQMLYYIKESIRLGKTKQQFLENTDFEKYWEDEDFLKAIEGK